MSDKEFVPATVSSFTPEQGFGRVTMQDGSEVPFDATVCLRPPKEGDAVVVELGTSRLGKPKVVYLMAPDDEDPRR